MLKILAIYDSDVSYVARLMDYIKKRTLTGFEVMAFTRRDSLEEYLMDRAIEILLIGEDVIAEELPTSENLRYIFCLSNQKVGNQGDRQSIYKYQAAGGVLSDILACYSRMEDSSGKGLNKDNRVISIFTPVSGMLEVTYSWILATCLAEKKKVLYLPLELLPVSPTPVMEGEDQALSEFIYYLKENNPKLMLKLKNLLKFSGKLPYLSGLSHGLDLISLNKEDALRLVEELKKNTDYEVIIFYLGMYSEFTIELMNLSDRIHILGKDSPYPISLAREWERQMKSLKLDPGQGKYKRVTIPEEEPKVEGAGSGMEQSYQRLWQLAVHHTEEL